VVAGDFLRILCLSYIIIRRRRSDGTPPARHRRAAGESWSVGVARGEEFVFIQLLITIPKLCIVESRLATGRPRRMRNGLH
jgi:hypothetical protein